MAHLQHATATNLVGYQNPAMQMNQSNSAMRQYSGLQAPISERSGSFVRIDDIQGIGAGNQSYNQQQTQPIVNPDTMRVTGTLKFFYENENYGFLVGDTDKKDVFFHMDDMKGTKLTKDQFANAKDNYTIRFGYNKLAYFGKYGLSMKAINIDFVEIVPLTEG